jgi:hypothetical protein
MVYTVLRILSRARRRTEQVGLPALQHGGFEIRRIGKAVSLRKLTTQLGNCLMMQLDHPQQFFAIPRWLAECLLSLWASGPHYCMNDLRLRVYRLPRGTVILAADLNIPEPEQEIPLGMNTPKAQKVKVTVEDFTVLMRVHPEIDEEAAKRLAARRLRRDNGKCSLILLKSASQNIAATAQYLVRLRREHTLAAVHVKVEKRAIGEDQVVQECVITKAEELVPNHWRVGKYPFKWRFFPGREVCGRNGHAQIDITVDIAGSPSQAASQPDGDHVRLPPQSRCYFAYAVTLRQVRQLIPM